MTQLNSNTKQAFQYGLASFQYVYREKLKTDIKEELREEIRRELREELRVELAKELKDLIRGMKREIQNEFAFYHVDSPMAPLPTIPEERINHDWIIPETESESETDT